MTLTRHRRQLLHSATRAPLTSDLRGFDACNRRYLPNTRCALMTSQETTQVIMCMILTSKQTPRRTADGGWRAGGRTQTHLSDISHKWTIYNNTSLEWPCIISTKLRLKRHRARLPLYSYWCENRSICSRCGSTKQPQPVAAPKLWNTIPIEIRNSLSLNIFKSKLKTFLFSRAYAS